LPFRKEALLAIRHLTAPLPRIKGVGIPIMWIASYFRGIDVDVEAKVFNARMILNTSDLISSCLLFSPNYYDVKERDLIRKIVKSGDLVVDVGANIGAYTLFLADLVGRSGKVIAIEAETENAARLRKNVQLNAFDWVEVVEGGVSDKEETLALLLNSTGNAGGHSFYEQSDTPNPPQQHISCVPLADLLPRDQAPAFMKLDIEGFEHRVLKRYFRDVPRKAWPHNIMLEDNPGRREDDAVELTTNHGYIVTNRVDTNVFLRSDTART
jgi:FkbM family methyltransferase